MVKKKKIKDFTGGKKKHVKLNSSVGDKWKPLHHGGKKWLLFHSLKINIQTFKKICPQMVISFLMTKDHKYFLFVGEKYTLLTKMVADIL